MVKAYEGAIFEATLPRGVATFALGSRGQGTPEPLTDRRLTVVTAYNPGEERPGEEENRRANVLLERHLLSEGLEFYPAVGGSPDRTHSEPSFAVLDLSVHEARALGRRFRQACVFYWDGLRGDLLWCC